MKKRTRRTSRARLYVFVICFLLWVFALAMATPAEAAEPVDMRRTSALQSAEEPESNPAENGQALDLSGTLSELPGQESWQPYLEQSPVSLQAFANAPLEALRSFWPEDIGQTCREGLKNYADVFVFLLLSMLAGFLAGRNEALLDLLTAGGCSILVWERMLRLAQLLCEKIESWRLYLLGFLPVYAGVLAAGGETAAAATTGGFFLEALALLAQVIGAWTQPLLQCYLALSAAGCICSEPSLTRLCRTIGRLLRQGLAWAGKLFAALLGVQRIFTGAADRVSLRAGQLLTGAVPIVGDALSGTMTAFLAGMQLLKGTLGFAAIAVLAVEFVPLYLYLLLHILLLTACGAFCSVTGHEKCEALFDCLRQAVQAMAATVALFFGLAVFGTALMLLAGTA
jgi:stage III sporulation protein AE